jgi:hypothetical protein
MTPVATRTRDRIADGPISGAGYERILVLFEPSRSGEAVLRAAAELTERHGSLTVVTLAPQAPAQRCCCGPGPQCLNRAVREEAQLELRSAKRILGPLAAHASFMVLVERRDPALPAWAGPRSFDLVILPSRRLSLGRSRLAKTLRRTTDAEVHLVG